MPVPKAEAFWHGWADGSTGRATALDVHRYLNVGAVYSREYYDLGLCLGECGVVARDAMAYLVERVKEEAFDNGDRSKYDPYDEIRSS